MTLYRSGALPGMSGCSSDSPVNTSSELTGPRQGLNIVHTMEGPTSDLCFLPRLDILHTGLDGRCVSRILDSLYRSSLRRILDEQSFPTVWK